MKPCRFCDAEVPYYGGDACVTCLRTADRLAFTRRGICPECRHPLGPACDCLLPGEAAREAVD